MPTEVYEIIAQGARYWFLFLMVLIVWRSYRWYRKDRRQYKKRLRLLPDAGYVGELVTVRGNEQLPTGTILPVPWEGILGSGRGCDLFLPAPGVALKHCWFSYDREDGLRLEPYHGRTVRVDDQTQTGRGERLSMHHGSRLFVGEVELRLRMFAGFETAARARVLRDAPQPDGGQMAGSIPVMTQEQFLQWQQQYRMQAAQQTMQQQAYFQWMSQQWAAQQAAFQQQMQQSAAMQQTPQPEVPADDFVSAEAQTAPEPTAPVAEPEFDMTAPTVEFHTGENFYPPEMTDAEEAAWPYAPWPEEMQALSSEDFRSSGADDDQTDAAAPPKSAYVGEDEAQKAKQAFWDRYLGGGAR